MDSSRSFADSAVASTPARRWKRTSAPWVTSIKMSDYGFPNFRCAQPVTTENVKALDDEE
jgi:hypothetical protein